MKSHHQHIEREARKQLSVAGSARWIVACSGGQDSMVLCHVLLRLGMPFSIAHVNYGLRGGESDRDETFVRAFAEQHQLTVFVYKSEMALAEHETKSGIQEWARSIRYAWFDQLIAQGKGDYVLLAHHEQDQAETILHQFMRGGGLASLTGMQIQNGRYIRPLLRVSKEELRTFALEEKIEWREDSSNGTLDYTRNFMRHEILPRLERVNPDLMHSLASRSVWFDEANAIVESALESTLETIITKSADHWSVAISAILDSAAPHLLLWKWLEPFAFTSGQIEMAMSLLHAESGKFMVSPKARLWKDRDQLILDFSGGIRVGGEVMLDTAPFELMSPIVLRGEWVVWNERIAKVPSHELLLDMEKIQWPLHLRPWREGDQFRPFGMQGRQKVSDLLIQHKIARSDKGGIYVLISGNTLLWVVGIRAAEDVRIAEPSGKVLRLILG